MSRDKALKLGFYCVCERKKPQTKPRDVNGKMTNIQAVLNAYCVAVYRLHDRYAEGKYHLQTSDATEIHKTRML